MVVRATAYWLVAEAGLMLLGPDYGVLLRFGKAGAVVCGVWARLGEDWLSHARPPSLPLRNLPGQRIFHTWLLFRSRNLGMAQDWQGHRTDDPGRNIRQTSNRQFQFPGIPGMAHTYMVALQFA
jgi:hypothetical protein